MARRSLKPQLNQIRTWVRQGRTDAWIAHQLDVAPRDIQAFKRDHDLAPDDDAGDADGSAELDEERDMRAQDEALVAAELEAMEDEDDEEDEDEDDEAEAGDRDSGDDARAAGGGGDDDDAPRSRRRGRRGGRRRRGGRGRRADLEGTFDHGEEGYGLWLDPAVQDDAVYAEHWKGHRPVTVVVEQDRIVIRRRGEDDGGGEAQD